MSKRITIILDEDLVRKLRILQSSLIQKRKKNVSFSRALNLVLQEGLKRKKNLVKSPTERKQAQKST